jgi:dihydrofolate reductase
MTISLIAVMSENRVIGNKNRIPWHIKDDLIHFKNLTLHHTVIMGRTTFDSILAYYKKSGRPIPERRHIIVSRDTNYTTDVPNCYIVHSVDEALRMGVEKEKEAMGEGGEVFVSGGASIFEQTIGKADKLHLTLVRGKFEGDTYFPDYSAFKKIIGEETKKTPEGLAYTFLDLER